MENNKYLELDKRMTKKVNKELRERGITKYPTICHYCKGEGCKHCNYTGQINYVVE